MRGALALALLAGLSACVSTAGRTPGAGAAADFDVARFFEGATQGRGTLKIVFQGREEVRVAGRGRVEDGVIILDQTVWRGERAAETRQWRLRADGAGRLSGTLSDAAGPVSGAVEGNVLHLRFSMNGGVKADQWLTLQPGGARVENVMVMRKFGLPVARLDEVILRVGE